MLGPPPPEQKQAEDLPLSHEKAQGKETLYTGAFDLASSSAGNPRREWQRSRCRLVPSLGDSSRQFCHPAVLFFKTKVIGIELRGFAKTLAINSAISKIAL